MPSSRLLAPAVAAIALAGAGLPTSADANAGARIVAFRILDADGSAAERPLDQGRLYRYRVRYRIGGAEQLRVGRALTLVGPTGRPVLLVRPPGRLDSAGSYTARGTLRLTQRDPTGLYRVRYTVLVRDPSGGRGVRRQRTLAVRFRNPARA